MSCSRKCPTALLPSGVEREQSLAALITQAEVTLVRGKGPWNKLLLGGAQSHSMVDTGPAESYRDLWSLLEGRELSTALSVSVNVCVQMGAQVCESSWV